MKEHTTWNDNPTGEEILQDISDFVEFIHSSGKIEREPEICPECFSVSKTTNLFLCPYCGFIESTFGKLAHGQTYLFNRLHIFCLSLQQAINYQLPKPTFRQHFNDCFGWTVML